MCWFALLGDAVIRSFEAGPSKGSTLPDWLCLFRPRPRYPRGQRLVRSFESSDICSGTTID